MSASLDPALIFISYAHEDTGLCKELEKHLVSLKQQRFIITWYDRMIGAGAEWEGQIHESLNKAGIILLLISVDFMNSPYCFDVEVRRAMERHEAGEARVIPVILRPVEWQSAPFGKLQALPAEAKPVTEWDNRDKAFLSIAQGIRRVLRAEEPAGGHHMNPPPAAAGPRPAGEERAAAGYPAQARKETERGEKREFEPEKFIDREAEQELFEELLRFDTPARILAIKDGGGTGKSQLLERLRYRCRTVKPRTPVSLIALDQLPDDSPLSFTRRVCDHLSASGLSFNTYTKLERARVGGHFSPFVAPDGARLEIANVVNTTAGLSPEQDRIAQEEVIRAFFDDLRQHCAGQPAVLILDSYERCKPRLKSWIEESLLEQFFLTQPASKLILLLAGQENPKFHLRWSREDCAAVVRSVNKLGTWTKEHVEECLRAHGVNYEARDIETLYGVIQMNTPVSLIVQVVQAARRARSSPDE
ncbi:MAG TPA: toll/interleukin-1 receptor domain-containing protein [Pyrinomonadaceae bacterium]|jgi:hypothetical protein